MTRRTAYLLKKFPRLSETFVVGEIVQQEALGADLFIFSRRRPDDEPRHPALERLQAPVEVLPGASRIDPWTELFGSEVDPAPIEQIGRLTREMHAFGLPRFPKLLSEAIYLLRRMREEAIDHVHVHFATESAIVAMLLKEMGGPPYSLTAHAKDIYRSTVDPRLLRLMIDRSRFTVTVCDANVRHLREHLRVDGDLEEEGNVRRLYNGIDLEHFAFRPDSRRENHVLAVGRLVAKKGFDVLVEALAQLRERPFSCTIVGEGEEREALQSLIRERGLEDRVELLGARDPDYVRGLLEQATVFCLPCVIGPDGNRDALPTVLIEAQASGLPVISTPVTGIPEILDHGRAGVLVPERDPAATAGAIADLLDDAGRREDLARAARARAEELFDARKAARTLFSWISERAPSCAS